MKSQAKQTAILTLILGFLHLGFVPQTQSWTKIGAGINEPIIRTLVIHPVFSNIVLAGTDNALYRSTDHGHSYKPVLQLSGSQKRINDIIAVQKTGLIAATDAGLYFSSDNGEHWQTIFYSSDPQSRECLSVAANGERIYVGTAKGLFFRNSSQSNWQRFKGVLNNEAIFELAADHTHLYVATDHVVYKLSKDSLDIQKIFSLSMTSSAQAASANGNGDTSTDNGHASASLIKSIVVHDQTHPKIYLGTTRGIFTNANGGARWQRMPTDGLPMEDLTSVLVTESGSNTHSASGQPAPNIFVSTSKGTYQSHNGTWLPLYKGMETTRVNDLASNIQGLLYAATDKGVFSLGVNEGQGSEATPIQLAHYTHSPQPQPAIKAIPYHEIQKNFTGEPSVLDVHQMAIDYADVHPEKIQGWKKQARIKALLPSVSAGVDRAASDLFHWDTGQSPDNLQTGREYLDWDVSVSWDFADLIWSTDQTSIDSRSKLMVELREDILDQITRLYFERRRIQVELMMTDFTAQPQLVVEKRMRIEELTALMDGFTGGRFSERLIRDKEKKELGTRNEELGASRSGL